ncbi:MAG: hypothetical protein ACK5HT_17170 [Draconibacterium sp.]
MLKPLQLLAFLGVIILITLGMSWGIKVSEFNLLDVVEADFDLSQNVAIRIDSAEIDSLERSYNAKKDIKPQVVDYSKQSFSYDKVSEGLVMLDKNLFRRVKDKLNKKDRLPTTTRILYMGDSQIEGDYIAASIRLSLQAKYGGKGPGLIAADEYYSSEHRLAIAMSDNWQQSKRMKIEVGNSSLLFRKATLNPGRGKGILNINRLKLMKTQEDYQQLRLFFISHGSSTIVLKEKNQPIRRFKILGSDKLQAIRAELKHTPSNLSIEIESAGKFVLNGLSLDDRTGVYVDNIPLRGKAFPLFSISDSIAMEKMCKSLKPDLFILQFGANIVSYATDKILKLYREETKKQIDLIRKWCPKAEILIVSVSDIADKRNRKFISYPIIKDLKAIQYEIAMQNNCAFWDLDYFIRQHGGIVEWVNKSPRSYAQKDYLHFTKYGARIIGERLSELLEEEFSE